MGSGLFHRRLIHFVVSGTAVSVAVTFLLMISLHRGDQERPEAGQERAMVEKRRREILSEVVDEGISGSIICKGEGHLRP